VLTTLPCESQHVTKCYTGCWTRTDPLEPHKQRKMDMRFGLRIGTGRGSCEHGNEPLGSIKFGEFLD
jgi:hypothetical protein